MKAKVKLSVLGFSFNQSKSGTYGLVLSEVGGLRRLMIIVGTPEAQSIAFRLHDTTPPRPLTHDLFKTIMGRFGIKLSEVLIYKYADGVFYSRLLLQQNNQFIEIESRTSDAIAIALRTNSPIFTTEDIMRKLAIVVKENDNDQNLNDVQSSVIDEIQNSNYNHYSVLSKEELENLLREALEIEDYELASVIRDEIRKKNEAINHK
ncbi:MAG: bifunctional nuclease domain-containing protein [Dysgonomonas sp.]